MKTTLRSLFVSVLLLASASQASAAGFLGLGVEEDVVSATYGASMSDDGSVVIGGGFGLDGNFSGFRWTAEAGVAWFERPANASDDVWRASADGSIVVGYRRIKDEPTKVGTWDADGVFSELTLPAELDRLSSFHAVDLAGDGRVVMAMGKLPNQNNIPLVYVDGEFQQIQGAEGFSPQAITGDGRVLLVEEWEGYRIQRVLLLDRESGEVQDVLFDGPEEVLADSMSDNGRWVVARASRGEEPPIQRNLLLWSEETGAIEVAEFAYPSIFPWSVSNAGQIVGYSTDPDGQSWAYIVDQQHGARLLDEVLAQDFGLADELEGWRLEQAYEITSDGRYIVGHGSSPRFDQEGYRADLSIEDWIPGDANFDGAVDLFDFNVVKTHFGSGVWRTEGDFNDDDAVDLVDFNLLKEHFGETTAVPEPCAAALLACAGLVSVGAGFRRRSQVVRRVER